MKSEKYIPEVDGLRGIAVALVLAFHLLPLSVTGGFIGVDIFFVISGFVITRKILADIDEGKFSLFSFYTNRIHRLLPALLFVLILSLFFAFHLFPLDEFRRFGASLLSATISLSNFKFWRESGYFDVGSDEKPLLHTWSLSVEEQFYVFWPILILIIYRNARNRLFLSITLFGILSFYLNYLFLHDRASIFFLTPFRIFEFCIGAICIPLLQNKTIIAQKTSIKSALSILALLAILYQSIHLGPGDTFPFYNALISCISAGILIVGSQGTWVGIFLSNRLMLFLGRTSYSIYLVHWPLIVFYKYYVYRELALPEVFGLLIASILLGSLLHFTVEQRFRISRREQVKPTTLHRNISSTVAIVTLAGTIALTAGFIRASNGIPWRITSGLAFDFNDSAPDYVRALAERRNGVLRDCADDCRLGGAHAEKIVLFVGDSHMDHYTLALSEISNNLPYTFKVITSAGCFFGKTYTSDTSAFESDCVKKQDELTRWLANPEVIGVVHGQRWPGYRDLIIRKEDNSHVSFPDSPSFFVAISNDVKSFYEETRPLPLLLVGDAPDAPDINCAMKNKPDSPSCQRHLSNEPMDDGKVKALANASQSYAGQSDYYLPRESLCKPDCNLMDPNGKMLFIDSNHLSLSGAKVVLPHLLATFYKLVDEASGYSP